MRAVFDDRHWRHDPKFLMANGKPQPSPEQAERIARWPTLHVEEGGCLSDDLRANVAAALTGAQA